MSWTHGDLKPYSTKETQWQLRHDVKVISFFYLKNSRPTHSFDCNRLWYLQLPMHFQSRDGNFAVTLSLATCLDVHWKCTSNSRAPKRTSNSRTPKQSHCNVFYYLAAAFQIVARRGKWTRTAAQRGGKDV